MIFSYNWLKEFVPKFPKPEKLAEVLTMHSFEVKDLKEVKNDWILDIEVTPNRADCFCHIGIVRECGALLNSKLKTQNSKPQLKTKNLKSKDFISIEVRDKDACPRYTARVIADVKVGESPKWMQERLTACGLQSINNVVDSVNYVMLEMGQPLHAFDFEKIKKIIVRRAKKGEKITTLDGDNYDLDADVLVIADEESPLAIAGIKGGKKAEINDKTKIVVLESANFNPQIIRKASRKLGLKTDASFRFEHGLDPNLTEIAINRAASLIQETAKGRAAQGLVDFYPKKVLAKTIKLDLDYVEKLLGAKISKEKIIKILQSLGLKIKKQPYGESRTSFGPDKLKILNVVVPTFRQDISIPEDLVEEIGRLYGYERLKPVLPMATLVPPQKNEKIFWEGIIKDILKELGFVEVYNYSFVSFQQISNIQYPISNLIELENPVSQEQKYMRPSLIPNLLKNINFNLNYFSEIKIFELGKVYRQGTEEKTMLTAVIVRKKAKDEFYEAKGVIDLLLNKLGISDVYYDEYQATPEDSNLAVWQREKCAEIKVNGEEIGFLGEVSPKLLEDLEIPKSVVFDIDFEKLLKLASEEQEYQPISSFPAAVRDLAVLVPRDIRVEEVLNKIETSGGGLVRDVDLFDIYEGEELPQGKKNFAFHIIYQASDRTLSGREINEIQKKIIETLEEEAEWEVRK